MKVRNHRQYRPSDVSKASEQGLIALSLEIRSGTRLSHFTKLVNTLRSAAFYAGLLEARSVTVEERACHAQVVAWSDEYLRRLLNFSEPDHLLRQSIGCSTSAKDARL